MSEEAVEVPAEGAAKKKSKKKLIIILAAIILLLGGGAGAYFGGFVGGKKADDAQAADAGDAAAPTKGEKAKAKGKDKEAADTAGVFDDLPDVLVNLDNSGRQAHFLKIKISLEVATKEDQVALDKVMPRVMDQFQTYLRELRTDDLKGAAGIYRLRQELLNRVSAAAAPIEVRDVLFRELLIQ